MSQERGKTKDIIDWVANEGLGWNPQRNMSHNIGGDWNPGKGDTPNYRPIAHAENIPCQKLTFSVHIHDGMTREYTLQRTLTCSSISHLWKTTKKTSSTVFWEKKQVSAQEGTRWAQWILLGIAKICKKKTYISTLWAGSSWNS